jgi:hypothetical protein
MTIDLLAKVCAPEIAAWRPQVVALQVGHPDCAPRPLSRQERAILSRVWPSRLRERIIRYLHEHRPEIIRRRGLRQMAPPLLFGAGLAAILSDARAVQSHLIILPIARVTAKAEVRDPGYNVEIERYNAILRQAAAPDVTCLTQDDVLAGLAPDDYAIAPESVHWNARGHAAASTAIVRALDAIRERRDVVEVAS